MTTTIHPAPSSIQAPPYSYTSVPPNVDSIIRAVSQSGPFVAEGRFGPSAYLVEPVEFAHRIDGRQVHYWPRGAERREEMAPVKIIVRGASRHEGGHVYFNMAEVALEDPATGIATCQPSTDQRIFVVSARRFSEQHTASYLPLEPAMGVPLDPRAALLADLFRHARSVTVIGRGPSDASRVSEPVSLSPEKEAYISRLLEEHRKYKQGASSDERHEVRQTEWRKIGQEIFDHYKELYEGDSIAAGDALVEICDTIRARFVRDRANWDVGRSIESAWDGVGDENYGWMA